MPEPELRIGDGVPVATPPTGAPSPKPSWLIPALAVLLVVVVGLGLGVAYILGRQDVAAEQVAAPRLDSPQAIAARLAELGAPCADLKPISDPAGAAARSTCYVGSNDIIISVYASHADVEANWKSHTGLLAGLLTTHMVIGDVWSINGSSDPEWTKMAAQLLGAEYRML